jgi:spore coat protein CotF
LLEDHLDHAIEHGGLVWHMSVQHHRITVDRLAEAAHR